MPKRFVEHAVGVGHGLLAHMQDLRANAFDARVYLAVVVPFLANLKPGHIAEFYETDGLGRKLFEDRNHEEGALAHEDNEDKD